ncbi:MULTISPECIES: DUF6380 family protein [unclassified Streptomyces]|nr:MULTISPECIES: DUF6380 family protein [unclassified Streptomyces]
MDPVDNSVQGDAAGEERHATLRSRTASLTATAGRAPLQHHGVRAGEGVR